MSWAVSSLLVVPTVPLPPVTIDRLRQIIAAVFIGLFVIVWVWIAVKTFLFHATPTKPKLVLGTGFVSISGALAGSVAAGTAAVLGVKVQQFKAAGVNLRGGVGTVLSPLIVAGVLAYLAIGLLLVGAWLVKGDASPEIVQSFSLGATTWCAAAFGAVFVATS
jgi:hypothetical protein